MDVIAKKHEDGRQQTLMAHTLAVLQEVIRLIDKDMLVLIAQKTGFSAEKLKDLIFYAAYFHDIGKATEEFRKTIEDKSKSFHALYSASLVKGIAEFELNVDEEEYVNLLFLTIITHHTLYDSMGIYKNIKYEQEKYNFHFLPYAQEFFNSHQAYYEEFIGKPCPYMFQYDELPIQVLADYIDEELRDDIEKVKNKQRFWMVYCYVQGILNIADWMASAKFDATCPEISFSCVPTKQYLLNQLKDALSLDNFIPRHFQQCMSQVKGNVLVEIPTGEGKTEGSLLWAVNNIKHIHSKIIYTLPTQTTSNKLYERVKAIFNQYTGLIHGAAAIYLEKIYEQDNGYIDECFKSELLFGKTFNKPATVSTIDGLLKYFLNLGRYNIGIFNILNAQVIIDEVHCYDLKLMGFLKRFLQLAETYNIPVCLMSASIPEKIKELLDIKHYPVIKDVQLFDKKANHIIKVEGKLEEDIAQILTEYYKGKKILIVRNTVQKAAQTFEVLREKGICNIMLYHSQFKKKDRIRKEEQIYRKLENKEHFILVATQVVEVSLDIDFDIMFTDIAPIECLIQRFGRVNRKKNIHRIGKIYIYSQTDIKPYTKEILDLTFSVVKEGIFCVGEYSNWLNKVYNLLFETIELQNKLSDKFDEGYARFDKQLQRLEGIQQSDGSYDLRDIEYPKKDYILVDDYEKGNLNYENTVSLGAWLSDSKNGYLLERKNVLYHKKFDVLDLKYNYQMGVKFPEGEKSELFI